MDNFNNEIKDGIVLVDFFATWCGPCKMQSPIIDSLKEERSDIKIMKVDVDKEEDVARTYGIMSIPTLMLFKDGKEVAKNVGFMPKEVLTNWINENR